MASALAPPLLSLVFVLLSTLLPLLAEQPRRASQPRRTDLVLLAGCVQFACVAAVHRACGAEGDFSWARMILSAAAILGVHSYAQLLRDQLAALHDRVGPRGAFRHARLYTGMVRHARLWPAGKGAGNSFLYRVCFMFHELAAGSSAGETASNPSFLDGALGWASSARISHAAWPFLRHFCVVSWSQSDWLSKQAVLDLIARERPDLLGDEGEYRVFLLSNWRFLGFSFNPIAHYFVYKATDQSRQATAAADVTSAAPSDVHPGFASLDAQLGSLVCLVSEVHNTPWGEKCWYVHPVERAEADALVLDSERGSALCAPSVSAQLVYTDLQCKKMHVSPFMEMPYDYQLAFAHPGDSWHVRWRMLRHKESATAEGGATAAASAGGCPFRNSASGSASVLPADHPAVASTFVSSSPSSATSPLDCHFTVHMSLDALPITQRNLTHILLAYPLHTFRVVLGIYWQAALLFLHKGATFHPHPDLIKANAKKDA